MKLLSMLTALACLLLTTTSLFAAQPKAKHSGPKPLRSEPDLPGQFHAKHGGESKAGLRQQILQEFDANGDGKLGPDEQAAARKAAADRRKQRKHKGGPGAASDLSNQPNGIQPLDGQPLGGTAGPRGNGRAKLMERFDLNRDGLLSPQEEARARAMMQKHGGSGAIGGGLPQGPGGFGGAGPHGKGRFGGAGPQAPGPQNHRGQFRQ